MLRPILKDHDEQNGKVINSLLSDFGVELQVPVDEGDWVWPVHRLILWDHDEQIGKATKSLLSDFGLELEVPDDKGARAWPVCIG